MRLYALADRLRMTVAELQEKLPVDEFVHWIAFHRIRAEQLKR